MAGYNKITLVDQALTVTVVQHIITTKITVKSYYNYYGRELLMKLL